MEPAPLERMAIERVLAPFGSSTGLPAAAYRSPEVFTWEAAHLFAATWFCLGRVEDLIQPGQARAVRAGDETVLLVRDSDVVRVFSNVCRHRGHELAPVGEAFDTRFIHCPYHAWTYRPDGSLMTAPTFSNRSDFEEGDYPLAPVDADIWEGWLFVNLDGRADPIDGHTGTVCEGVQRGMANSGYRQGPLSTWEATVYQFLSMVARAYAGEGLTPSPVEERSLSPLRRCRLRWRRQRYFASALLHCKYSSMNGSRSPSSTPWMFPTSRSVRRSLTI